MVGFVFNGRFIDMNRLESRIKEPITYETYSWLSALPNITFYIFYGKQIFPILLLVCFFYRNILFTKGDGHLLKNFFSIYFCYFAVWYT